MVIKSLKWRAKEYYYNGVKNLDEYQWEGHGLGSIYTITKMKTLWHVWLINKPRISKFKTLEAAQAACQKEFEGRIKEWIE